MTAGQKTSLANFLDLSSDYLYYLDLKEKMFGMG
jgi:hypothetical protein